MKQVLIAVLIVSVTGGLAQAAGVKNTVSLGYAYTDLGGALSGNARGLNLKYNAEDLNSGFGGMGSFTFTTADIQSYSGGKAGDMDYSSFLVGPSYRFNEYLNAYVMAGLGHGHIDDKRDNSGKKTGFAYGAGVQINPVENIAINASYEYSRFSAYDSKVNAGTWVLGVGYSFLIIIAI
ncbi:Ail/OmpX-like protein [Salmonella sp. NCTC 11881]|nr:Ail/OmpX-like protein [Salmonella sp. NCTC 11881]